MQLLFLTVTRFMYCRERSLPNHRLQGTYPHTCKLLADRGYVPIDMYYALDLQRASSCSHWSCTLLRLACIDLQTGEPSLRADFRGLPYIRDGCCSKYWKSSFPQSSELQFQEVHAVC
jgi:hypothetical protein